MDVRILRHNTETAAAHLQLGVLQYACERVAHAVRVEQQVAALVQHLEPVEPANKNKTKFSCRFMQV
jgi:hypothetical protein